MGKQKKKRQRLQKHVEERLGEVRAKMIGGQHDFLGKSQVRRIKFPEAEEMLIQDIQSIQWDQSLITAKARPEEVRRDIKTHHIFLSKETKGGGILAESFFWSIVRYFGGFCHHRLC